MRDQLKRARLAKGLSVIEIAKRIGVSPAVYYKWEAGTRAPLLDNARQVSKILEKSIEELFFNENLEVKKGCKTKRNETE